MSTTNIKKNKVTQAIEKELTPKILQYDDNDTIINTLKGDFVAFLFVLWDALRLPQPTRIQIDIAKELAKEDNKRFILQAFRGVGKSFIACAYVVWILWNNPQYKILIVSASKERADANSIFIKNIIDLLPFLEEMKPRGKQRDSNISFDVGLAVPDHSPSVKSVGILGQLTGSRADIILADDIEVTNNSATPTAREKLLTNVAEFAAILKPLPTSRTIFLGTPQTEMTIYKELEESRGYSTIIWSAQYPRNKQESDYYGSRLAPLLRKEYEDNPEFLAGSPTDPIRFDRDELRSRELEYGKAGYTLQFMLNPNLSDLERFPLRLRDAIICPVDMEVSPLSYQWLPNPQNRNLDLPNVGLPGDDMFSFHSCSNKSAPYQLKIMTIDPAGRGKDETGFAVFYYLNGYIFLMDVGGFVGGYDEKTLLKLAVKAKFWGVNKLIIESNFGDGMFTQLIKPVLLEVFPCSVEEVRSKKAKELRICDTLEPLLGSHKLIIRDDAIREDYQTARNSEGVQDVNYSAFYQMTRITRTTGALKHDDRLDAIASGVEWLKEYMSINSLKQEDDMTEEYIRNHMESPLKGWEELKIMYSGSIVIKYSDEDSSNNFLGNKEW